MAVKDLDKLEDVLKRIKKLKKLETDIADTISVSVVVREDA